MIIRRDLTQSLMICSGWNPGNFNNNSGASSLADDASAVRSSLAWDWTILERSLRGEPMQMGKRQNHIEVSSETGVMVAAISRKAPKSGNRIPSKNNGCI